MIPSDLRNSMPSVRARVAAICVIFVSAVVGRAGEIGLASGKIDTSKEPEATVKSLGGTVGPGGKSLAIVQFSGPVQHESLKAIQDAGATVHHYLPQNAYLVSFAPIQFDTVRKARGVNWIGDLPATRKIHPTVSKLQTATLKITILSVDDLPATTLSAKGIKIKSHRKTQMGWFDTRAEIPSAELQNTSKIWSVFHIELQPEYKLRGERAAQTAAGNYLAGASAPTGPGYVPWLASKGLTGGSNIIFQIQDDGLDQGIATNLPGTAHVDILGRIIGIFNATADALGDCLDGHGELNAGIIMGNATAGTVDASGYKLGQGLAPQSRVYATKIFENFGGFDIGSNTFTDLARFAQNAGAIFSTNSWGASVNGAYTADSAEFDALTRDADPTEGGNQPMIYFFATGNSGPSAGTVGSPGTAKNVITVGAGENSDADGTDGCGVGPADANSIRDVVFFSSRGPTADGRQGVTLFSVGTHVQGPASTDPGYNGSSVCDQYWPAGQTNYARSSGTSHSTPTACGAGLIVYEFFRDQLSSLGHTATPSPALIKAVMTNTATDMVGGNDGNGGFLTNIPNPNQGWGAVDLARLIDNKNALYSFDQGFLFTGSGQFWEQSITPVDPAKPLKISLAWTDVPGVPGASPELVNDLDLKVINGATTYLGNVFASGFSATGGTPDRLNNLEAVYIQNPSGLYTLRVEAFNIAGNGVPNVGGSLDQDFAVFVWNGTVQTSAGTIKINKKRVNCNDAIQVTVSDKDLKGTGSLAVNVSTSAGDSENFTLNEIAPNSGILNRTISTSGAAPAADGVLEVSDGSTITATYHDLDDGTGTPRTVTDTAVVDCSPPIISNVHVNAVTTTMIRVSFDTNEPATGAIWADVACGGTAYTATTNLGTTHLATFSGLLPCTPYYVRLSATDLAANVSTDNNGGLCYQATTLALGATTFTDDIEPRAAPGWTHSAAGGTDNWNFRADVNAHSPSHDFSYTPGLTVVCDSPLVTPDIQGGGQFSFWHTYGFEDSGGGYDGGVLEISTDDGVSWNDLGPHIIQGAYTGTISAAFGSPIAGRPAWTGWTLGPMTQVLVDLGAYPGTVRIRFRLASDDGVASTGWFIDDVSVVGADPCVSNAGSVQFDKDFYTCGDLVKVEVRDANAPASPLPVTITTAAGDSETVMVTDPDSDKIYQGSILLGATGDAVSVGDGTLQGGPGGTLRVVYNDANDGTGNPRTSVDVATLDCLAPIISNVVVSNVTLNSFKVSFNTNENAFGAAFADLNCGGGSYSGSTPLGMFHQLTFNGLMPCTSYRFRLQAADQTGNLAVADNGGSCFLVVTMGDNPVYFADFENLELGWTPTGLWHLIDNTSAYPQATSGTHSWWYGSEATGTYNSPPGIANSGTLKSGPIFLPPSGAIELSFNSWEQTEGYAGFDTQKVYVERLDTTQTLLWTSALNTASWQPVGPIDLTPWAGQTVRLKFVFDTVDGFSNDFRGWYVDDVRVRAIVPCFPNASRDWTLYE